VVSALVPYKRLDVAIEACRRVGASLTVVGRGPELKQLQRLGPDVRFTGWLADEEIRQLYRRSSAVLLPGIEDFGMVPVEAQACGTPVVAFAQGGAAETILDGVTGVLVDDPSAEAFAAGIARVTSLRRDRPAIRANAERFSRERFMTAFTRAVDDAVAEPEAVTW
jgi:glycosyltransferase involved in cell wall biosynthesis